MNAHILTTISLHQIYLVLGALRGVVTSFMLGLGISPLHLIFPVHMMSLSFQQTIKR